MDGVLNGDGPVKIVKTPFPNSLEKYCIVFCHSCIPQTFLHPTNKFWRHVLDYSELVAFKNFVTFFSWSESRKNLENISPLNFFLHCSKQLYRICKPYIDFFCTCLFTSLNWIIINVMPWNDGTLKASNVLLSFINNHSLVSTAIHS